MRHQSTVDFSAIEAESFKALKLKPRTGFRQRTPASLLLWIARIPSNLNPGAIIATILSSLMAQLLTEYLEHYAAWGEDLVLALRPGEIIPSERLRDTETGIGPGGRYLWLRAQRLRWIYELFYGMLKFSEKLITYYSRLRMKAHNLGIKVLPQWHLRVLSG
ncbi:hypothetical protein ACFX2A_036148 [Malus domestica]